MFSGFFISLFDVILPVMIEVKWQLFRGCRLQLKAKLNRQRFRFNAIARVNFR